MTDKDNREDHRSDDADPNKRYFRSDDRVFRQGDGWYYSLREGDRGPYADEATARAELARFIQEQIDLKQLASGKSMKEEVREQKLRPRPKGDVWDGLPDVD